jgi:MATE family multidrug resistance protein
MMLTGVVDTMMVGHLGAAPLAALALGHTWHWAFLIVCLGLLMGIDPLIAQAHGRGDERGCTLAMKRGFVLAALLSVPACIALAATGTVLLAFGQDPALAEMAQTYNLWKLPAAPAMLLFTVQRQYLQGRSIMAPGTWAMVIANAFNVFANWVLIWGKLGFPALGLTGAAIATSLTTLLMPCILWGLMRALRLYPATLDTDKRAWSRQGLWQIVKLGAPVGIHMGLESWAFSGSALLAGWINVLAVSGHHVTLNLAALSFMLPLGISIGASARVGNLIGAQDLEGMRRAIRASLLLTLSTMVISASTLLLLSRSLAKLYTSDPPLIALVASLLPIVAAFQISDGMQVVSAGILRGMGRPRPGAIVNLVSYYVIAFPLAYTLAFRAQLGVRGIWIALAVGVTFAAVLLLTWTWRTAKRELSELTHAVADAN